MNDQDTSYLHCNYLSLSILTLHGTYPSQVWGSVLAPNRSSKKDLNTSQSLHHSSYKNETKRIHEGHAHLMGVIDSCHGHPVASSNELISGLKALGRDWNFHLRSGKNTSAHFLTSISLKKDRMIPYHNSRINISKLQTHFSICLCIASPCLELHFLCSLRRKRVNQWHQKRVHKESTK